MAKQVSIDVEKKLEEQLTCTICFDLYNDPRTLPCFHSYCLKCIQHLPVDEEENQITCPACRKAATLANNGVTDLPAAFVINSLLEIQKFLEKSDDTEDQQICCDNCQATSATRYCEDCDIRYCEDCLILHNKLKVNMSHHITDVKDVHVASAASSDCKEQETIINCTSHNKPLKIFCETCQELICQSCTIRRHRNHDYDVIADVLPRQRQEIRSFLRLIRQKIATKTSAMIALTKRGQEIIKQGQNTKKEIHQYAQQIIESVQQCEKLLNKQVETVVQRKLKLLGEQVKEVETALKQLKSCEEYIEQNLEVGSPQQILLEKQRMIQGIGVAGEPINPEVFQPVEEEALQPVEEADIAFIRNKVVVESYRDVVGKVTCSFSYPPSKPRKVVMGLDKPHCVAVNGEGTMVVGAEGQNCITVIDKDGSIVRSFGLGRYGACYGIAFAADGHVIATNVSDHTLYKLTLHGDFVTSVGGLGSEPLKFNWPGGLAIHPLTGQIYVTDNRNHRIQVINNNFTYSYSITNKGRTQGQWLLNPCDVALDEAGNVYVCNTGNTSINIFTSSGKFIRRFSNSSSLGSVVSITIDRHNLVYVADTSNHCISMFTIDGQFIKSMGSRGSDEGQFNYPQGVTVDRLDNLLITDSSNKRLVIF